MLPKSGAKYCGPNKLFSGINYSFWRTRLYTYNALINHVRRKRCHRSTNLVGLYCFVLAEELSGIYSLMPLQTPAISATAHSDYYRPTAKSVELFLQIQHAWVHVRGGVPYSAQAIFAPYSGKFESWINLSFPTDSDRNPERAPRYFWKQFRCDFWGYSSENMGCDQLSNFLNQTIKPGIISLSEE